MQQLLQVCEQHDFVREMQVVAHVVEQVVALVEAHLVAAHLLGFVAVVELLLHLGHLEQLKDFVWFLDLIF